MVGKLVLGDCQHKDGLDPSPEVNEVHNLLIESQPGDGLVQVVDGGDA